MIFKKNTASALLMVIILLSACNSDTSKPYNKTNNLLYIYMPTILLSKTTDFTSIAVFSLPHEPSDIVEVNISADEEFIMFNGQKNIKLTFNKHDYDINKEIYVTSTINAATSDICYGKKFNIILVLFLWIKPLIIT